jgi:hypothetical protein
MNEHNRRRAIGDRQQSEADGVLARRAAMDNHETIEMSFGGPAQQFGIVGMNDGHDKSDKWMFKEGFKRMADYGASADLPVLFWTVGLSGALAAACRNDDDGSLPPRIVRGCRCRCHGRRLIVAHRMGKVDPDFA